MDLSQTQRQTQIMSAHLLQSLKLLSLSSIDLTDAIYKEAEENPALIIVRDAHSARHTTESAEGTRASDDAQAALEAQPDSSESLQSHLIRQINMMNLKPEEHALCERLIYNLDERGFHMLAPVSLLDRKDPSQTEGLLEKCMGIVRSLDPKGICVTNIEESLLVQARERGDEAPALAIFLLDGHLDMMEVPSAESISRRVRKYQSERKKLFGAPPNPLYDTMDTSPAAAQAALDFIRTLDPYPARGFSTEATRFVSADVYVERIEEEDRVQNDGVDFVSAGGALFRVRLARDVLPVVAVNPEFKSLIESRRRTASAAQIKDLIRKASLFLDMIEFRQSTLLCAACEIVRRQTAFFLKRDGTLSPLRMKDLSRALDVNASTISRMANSKYIQCDRGLFPVKYFFTNPVSAKSPNVSRDKTLSVLRDMLEKEEYRTMSDRLLVEALSSRGITISRRTVAKYRAMLDIPPSYRRGEGKSPNLS